MSVSKPRNNGEWTEARWRSFVISALRSATRRYPPKYKTLNKAFIEKRINKKTGKLASHYKCAVCNGEFVAKDVQVDHTIPVVGPEGFVGWDSYIERMFCDVDNLQVLCKTCHDVKTKEENATKRISKKGNGDDSSSVVLPRVSGKRTSRGSGGSSKPIRKVSKRRNTTARKSDS